MKTVFLSLLTLLVVKSSSAQKTPVRYVALGDSYTICTGTTAPNSWPVLLTQQLNENKIITELIANPSHNGWTTQDLIDTELPVYDKSNPTFATLLIGVNDWVQGVDEKTFQKNLVLIIDHLQSKLANKSNLVLVTIPDFGVTPTGARYSNGRNISDGIRNFNSIIIAEAKKRNLKTVDVCEKSQEMDNDKSLIAGDGLHPSAKEYAIWETLIYPVIYGVLK